MRHRRGSQSGSFHGEESGSLLHIRGHGGILHTSDPRNGSESRMLRMIGKAEQAGTGVRNMYATCHDIGLDPPVIEENDKPE